MASIRFVHLLQRTCYSSVIQRQFCTSKYLLANVEQIPENLPTRLKDELPKYIDGFNDIPELESASPEVKKIFSLDMASHKDLRMVLRTINTDKYESDLEKNIANTTCQIRMMTEQLKQNHKDMKNKVLFIWLIDQRKKLLRKLEAEDINKYYSIVKEYNIPPLQSPHEKHNKYKFRKYKINVPLVKKRKIEDFEHDRIY